MKRTEEYKEAKPYITVAVGFLIWLVWRKALALEHKSMGGKELAMEHAREWMDILESEK